jgi:hypothetical protein
MVSFGIPSISPNPQNLFSSTREHAHAAVVFQTVSPHRSVINFDERVSQMPTVW